MATESLLRAVLWKTAADYRLLERSNVMDQHGYPTSRLSEIGRRLSVDKMTRDEIVDLCKFLQSPEFERILEAVGLRMTKEEFLAFARSGACDDNVEDVFCES